VISLFLSLIALHQILGNTVISGAKDSLAILWDLRKNSKIFALSCQTEPVSDVELFGSHAIVSSHDGKVRAYEIRSARCSEAKIIASRNSPIFASRMCCNVV